MIRLVFLQRRKPHLSVSEFHERWRDDHGPLVASHQTRLGMLRYTQTHRLDDPAAATIVGPRGQMEEPYDAVSEVWWPSVDALVEALGSEAGKRADAEILEAESDFIDLPNSPLWLAHEYPQFSTTVEHVVARPGGRLVKAHFVVRHRSDLTLQEAQTYWHTHHGPRVRSFAPSLNMLSYQQVHRFETPLEAELRASRGVVVDPYMGHAEMWWDHSIPRTGPDSEEIRRQAIEDESRFLDFSRCGLWTGKEHVLVDRW